MNEKQLIEMGYNMSYGFPNWMFAAIAIAAYELGVWIRRQFAWPQAIWISYGIIAVCVIVILIRLIIARIRRPDEKGSNDDDWRNY